MSTRTGFVRCILATATAVPALPADHPDLSGVWAYAIDLPPAAIKKEVNGKVSAQKLDTGAATVKTQVAGAPPFTASPSSNLNCRPR